MLRYICIKKRKLGEVGKIIYDTKETRARKH
jgi:hypothetical protein